MIDYAKHFKTSSAVYLELKALTEISKKTKFDNNFYIAIPSKRYRRFLKMYYILRKSEK